MQPDNGHFANRIPSISLAINRMYVLKVVRGVWVATIILFFLWLLWTALQAVPAVDDFCYGAGGHLHGILGNIVYNWQYWSGRYVATFLITLFAYSQPVLLHHYYLVPLFILILNVYALKRLLGAFSEDRLIIWLGLSALLMAFFQMRQSLFWLAGGATYGVACGIFMLLMAEEFKIFTGKVVPSNARLLALGLGTIILAGCNEGVMLAHTCLLLPLSLTHYAASKNYRLIWVLIVAMLAGLLAALAPGNFVRAALMHAPPTIPQAVWTSLLLIVRRYSLTLLLLAIVLHVFLKLFASGHATKKIGSTSHELLLVVFLFGALWAEVFSRVYVLGGLGPCRTHTGDYMLIIVMAFCLARYSHNKYSMRAELLKPLGNQAISFIAVFTLVSLLLLAKFISYPHQSLSQVVTHIRMAGELRQFMDKRFAQVAHAGSNSSLEVKQYNIQPLRPITFFQDITPHAQQWENRCFSEYFGLQQITSYPAK